MAATACAPPALRRCVTPAFRAQYSTSGLMEPSCRGGVARTTVSQPATWAGTASRASRGLRGRVHGRDDQVLRRRQVAGRGRVRGLHAERLEQ